MITAQGTLEAMEWERQDGGVSKEAATQQHHYQQHQQHHYPQQQAVVKWEQQAQVQELNGLKAGADGKLKHVQSIPLEGRWRKFKLSS